MGKIFLVEGKYTTAKVHASMIDDKVISQIYDVTNRKYLEGTDIAIMPDTHFGKGVMIGTTIKLNGKVDPELVGSDIGCGVLTVVLKDKVTDLKQFDEVVHEYVPAGARVHEEYKKDQVKGVKRKDFKCGDFLSEDKFNKSYGTNGTGNHYLELSEDSEGVQYLTVHTGSRYVGGRVCKCYKDKMKEDVNKQKRKEVIKNLKDQGKQKEISKHLKNLGKETKDYIEGSTYEDYLHDMKMAQLYAKGNREEIAFTVLKKMGIGVKDYFDTVHNYIDVENEILRKGAVSAKEGERLVIPFNMRDGSIIAVGKGNKDWNESAPHGAGRVMSRTKAKELLNFEEYKDQMEGIYSSTVVQSTLDEAPKAYKPMDVIIEDSKPTMDVIKVIKPIYNFKGV